MFQVTHTPTGEVAYMTGATAYAAVKSLWYQLGWKARDCTWKNAERNN